MRVLAEAGVERGHDVTVLVTSLDRHTQRTELNGVKLIKTSRWINVSSAPISPPMFFEARTIGRTADIVHLHFPYPLGEMAHLFSGSARQNVITYHSDIVRQKTLRTVYQPFLWRISQSRSDHRHQRTLHRHLALLQPVQIQMPHLPLGTL